MTFLRALPAIPFAALLFPAVALADPSPEEDPAPEVAAAESESGGDHYATTAVVDRPPGPGETSLGGTGSRMNLPLREVPSTVQVVELETARERGAADLTDVLFLVPGLTPMWTYGGFLQVRSRGFRAVVLQDGRRDDRSTFVNSHPQGGLWDLDRVEVLKGPASVLYGHGAVGGVVNLVRRRPSSTAAYELDFALGTPEQWRAHLGATGPIAKPLTYRLDVGHTMRRDFRGHLTERTQGTLSFGYTPHRDHAFLVRGIVYQDHYNTDSGIPTIEGPDGRRTLPPNARLKNRYNSPQDGLDYRRIDLELAYEWSLSEHLKLRERLSHARDTYAYFAMEGLAYDASGERPVVQRTFPFYFHHHWFPVSNQLELLGDVSTGPIRHRFLVGYDFVGMWNAFSDRASNIFDAEIPPVDFRHPIDTSPTIPIRRDSAFVASMQTHALLAQDHISFPYGFHLVVGGRLDVFSFETRRDMFDPNTGARTSRGLTDERSDLGATYRVGLVHEVFDPLSWYVSYSTAFAPNARLGLQPAIRDDEGVVTGFRDIEPERGAQVELGTRLSLFEALDLHLAGFHIRRTNVTVPVSMDRFDTAGEVRSRGLEADLTYRARHLAVMAGYALTDANYHVYRTAEGVDLSGKRPNFVARHGGTLWITVMPIERIGIAFGGRALGRQFADEANRLELSPYVLADAAIWFRTDRLRFTLTVQNLLQERRYFVSSIETNLTPGPPREALAQVQLLF